MSHYPFALASQETLCHACLVPEIHFDEWIAPRYEVLWPELFDPVLVDATVNFLADLAGAGPP